jgi:inorganic pyrophosphatase
MTVHLPEQMRYRSHPWHGVTIGDHAPTTVNCYIEIVPTDTIKYELDKETGLLKVDRPQQYSSLCPNLYGFIPQTYCGKHIAEFCQEKTGKKHIIGDGDPLDICILTEKMVVRGDILVKANPIGGFRLLDGDEADDKIIAVMVGDFVYGQMKDIKDCPPSLIERLRHYFLTYKDTPETNGHRKVQITHVYGHEEAYEAIHRSQLDYKELIKKEGKKGRSD